MYQADGGVFSNGLCLSSKHRGDCEQQDDESLVPETVVRRTETGETTGLRGVVEAFS